MEALLLRLSASMPYSTLMSVALESFLGSVTTTHFKGIPRKNLNLELSLSFSSFDKNTCRMEKDAYLALPLTQIMVDVAHLVYDHNGILQGRMRVGGVAQFAQCFDSERNAQVFHFVLKVADKAVR